MRKSGFSAKVFVVVARKDLLDIASLHLEELEWILTQAEGFRQQMEGPVRKTPVLTGKTVLTLFYEPSTRTRSSFEIAAKRLSADVTNFAVSSSSVVKGESVQDTIDTLQAMQADYIVVRHAASGVPWQIARSTKASVLNAGDGWHAHPTQALLDAVTLREIFPDLNGVKVLIAGDIQHSRVARSTMLLMRRLGCEVAATAPRSLLPQSTPPWLRCFATLDEALDWEPQVVYLLRMQKERMTEQFVPGLHEYHQIFGLTDERLQILEQRGIYVMHPGPVNRGVELSDGVMEYSKSLINKQVKNGILARMAVLTWLQPGANPPCVETKNKDLATR